MFSELKAWLILKNSEFSVLGKKEFSLSRGESTCHNKIPSYRCVGRKTITRNSPENEFREFRVIAIALNFLVKNKSVFFQYVGF